MASPFSNPNIHHHERFYFPDGSLYLLVEKSLYRVHRSLFELHASKFPACGLDTPDGEIHFIKDVNEVDFDRFLACLYPRALLVEEAETTEEWMSILKLASKWGFETLRSRALSKVERTIASPVDMILFGRQYDNLDVLLSGYVTLCQDTTPLSSEEGCRLGVDAVINVYRIRHELQSSTARPVSSEILLEKVRTLLSNEEQEQKQDLETEQPDSDGDDEENSQWTDAASIATSPLAETGPSLTADTYADASSSNGQVVRFLYEQQRAVNYQQTVFGIHVGAERLKTLTAGSVFGQKHANTSSLGDERYESFDQLTMWNFGPVSDDILRWIQARPDGQRLYHIARMVVKKAIEEPGKTDAYVLLCKKMVVDLKSKFQLGMGSLVKAKTLLRRYLGEICQEILTAADDSELIYDTSQSQYKIHYPVKFQRLRLIEFVAKFSEMTSSIFSLRPIVNKWITSLLDVHDGEKLATLCLLLKRAGPGWDTSNRKLRACMNKCFQKMTDLAQKTDNLRIRVLLQDVIRCRAQGWVAA